MNADSTVVIATRGSPLALAQARGVLADLEAAFPDRVFRLEIVRTTGDRLQLGPATPGDPAPEKGLFTKELEAALLGGAAHVAVHSLKDLPTELPEGLVIGAVPPRADVRDVLLYRDGARVAAARDAGAEWRPGAKVRTGFPAGTTPEDLPEGAVVATGSPRRAAILRSIRADLTIVPIRGNVGTRLARLMDDDAVDATLLAAAGLVRLGLDIGPRGELRIDPRLPAAIRAGIAPPPAGILATLLEPEEMLPAVGQGALALEIRADDADTAALVSVLEHGNTRRAITAERAFLRATGGGCASAVAAYGRVLGHRVHLRGILFRDGMARAVEGAAPVRDAEALGGELGRNAAAD
jgi:hydroxymethylbilane synthase